MQASTSSPVRSGWLEQLPDGWSEVHLRWLANLYAGGTPDKSKEEYWTDGTIPWINSGAVNQGMVTEASAYISQAGFEGSSARWVPKGALVMALAGQGRTKGMVAQMGMDATCNQSMAAIVPHGVASRYLYYWLAANYRRIRSGASDDLRDGLNLQMLGDIPCPVPPDRLEQERIANFLDEQTARIDALIAEKEALLSRLAATREAYAFALTTQGEAAKGFVVREEPWLAAVPGHWAVPKLGYIAEVGNGSTPRREVPEYWVDGTIPWVTSTAIHAGTIESTDERITERALEECHLRMVRPGSTIVGLIGQGPTRGMAARLAIPATLSQNVAFVSARQGSKVSDEYLTVVLTGLYSAMRFLSDGVGGAHGAMNCDQLRALRVPMPPPAEQFAIVSEFRKREVALEALTTHAAAGGVRISVCEAVY